MVKKMKRALLATMMVCLMVATIFNALSINGTAELIQQATKSDLNISRPEASKDSSSFTIPSHSCIINEDYYGFIVEVTSTQPPQQQKSICKLVNKLLSLDKEIYWLSSKISFLSECLDEDDNVKTKCFEKGSFIVSFTEDTNKNNNIINEIISDQASSEHTYKIMEALTDIPAYILKEPRIVHLKEKGAVMASYYKILEEAGFQNNIRLNVNELKDSLTVENYDIFIWGAQGGGYLNVLKTLADVKLNNKIKKFVMEGGGYIGSCNGAYHAASGNRRPSDFPDFFPYDNTFHPSLNALSLHLGIIDRDIYRALPGSTTVKVKIVNLDSPLAFGVPEIIDNDYLNGPMFLEGSLGSNTEPLAVITDIIEFCPGSFVEECKLSYEYQGDNPWFDGMSDGEKYNMLNSWVNYTLGLTDGTPKTLWVTAKNGKGKIVAFGGHPEFIVYGPKESDSLRIVYNAIFYTSLKSNGKPINLANTLSHNDFMKKDVAYTTFNKLLIKFFDNHPYHFPLLQHISTLLAIQ